MAKDVSRLLAKFTDDNRRKEMETLLQNEPWLAESFLMQDDYSRGKDELRSETQRLQEQVGRAKQWDEWYAYNFGNTDPDDLTRDYKGLRDKFIQTGNAEPSKAAAAAKTASNPLEGIDFSDPEKALPEAVSRIKENLLSELSGQFVPREAIDREIQERIAVAQKFQDHKLGTAVAMQDKVAELRRKYEQDFGEAPPVGFAEQIYGAINQFKYQDPADAYNRLTVEKYRSKADADLQARLKSEREAGRQEALRDVQTRSTPDGGGANFPSAFNFERKPSENDPFNSVMESGHEFGDGAYGKALGDRFEEDLRSGKFGPLQ